MDEEVRKKKKLIKKNRQTKLILTFDEDRRRNYLTGFQKRKKERQNYYKDKLKEKIKSEKEEYRKEAKKYISKSYNEDDNIIPEVEDLIEPTVVELPEHTVTITDITDLDFSGGCGLRLGKNEEPDKRIEDYAVENSSQSKDVKELKKQKAHMDKRMEHIKVLEEKHRLIKKKLENGGKKKKKKRGGHKGKNKRRGDKKK